MQKRLIFTFLFLIFASLEASVHVHHPQFVPSAQDYRLPPKVVLLNDTSAWYHWGCTGTALAVKSQIVRLGFSLTAIPIQHNYTLSALPHTSDDFDDPAFFVQFKAANPLLLAELEAADIIVINGEGTLHGLKQGPLRLLYLAYLSKRHLNKHVEIISHSVYPNDTVDPADTAATTLYKKVYSAMDFVAVREGKSHRLMQQLGISTTLSFDCLPLYIRSYYLPKAKLPSPPSRPTLVVGGSVAWQEEGMPALLQYLSAMDKKGFQIKVLTGAKRDLARDDLRFIEYFKKHARMNWQEVVAESVDDWLDEIHQATLLVSGRFHYTIAAACLGRPFIALNSNTPKIEALHDVLPLLDVLSYTDPQLYLKLISQTTALLATPPLSSQELLDKLCELAEQNFVSLSFTSTLYEFTALSTDRQSQ